MTRMTIENRNDFLQAVGGRQSPDEAATEIGLPLSAFQELRVHDPEFNTLWGVADALAEEEDPGTCPADYSDMRLAFLLYLHRPERWVSPS